MVWTDLTSWKQLKQRMLFSVYHKGIALNECLTVLKYVTTKLISLVGISREGHCQ